VALAETAQLAVLLSLKDELSGPINRAESEVKSFGTTTTTASGQVTKAGTAMKTASGHAITLGGALNHAKSALGGLISGPLGMIGLTTGIFALGGAMVAAIKDAGDLAVATQKLTAITGESTQVASAQLAVFQKYGIAYDTTVRAAGFAEKTLGKLDQTQAKATKSAALLALEQEKLNIQLAGGKVKVIDAAIAHQKAADAIAAHGKSLTKLDALDQEYGLHLKDANGHIVDFQSVLLQVSDLMANKHIPTTEKDAVAAQLLGRSYQNLLPILSLGSAGFLQAEKDAAAFGLTLDKQSSQDLAKYVTAMRNLGDAVHGALLQIGIAIAPLLTDVANSVTGFLKGGGIAQIRTFARDLVGVAREIGTVAGKALDAFKGFWGALPEPLRQLLVGAVIGNKILKFTFGFSALDLGKTLLQSLGLMTIRAAVVNVSGGTVNGGPGGPGGPGNILNQVLRWVAAITAVTTATDLFQQALDQGTQVINQANLLPGQTSAFAATATPGQITTAKAAVAQGQSDLGPIGFIRGLLGFLPGTGPVVQQGFDRLTGYGAAVANLDKAATILDHAAGTIDAKSATGGSTNTTPLLLREQIGWLRFMSEKGVVGAAADRAITLAELKRHGGSLTTLSANILALKLSQEQAIAAGDKQAAASIGQDIRMLEQRFVSVEQARAGETARAAAEIRGAIAVAQNAIVFAISKIPGAPVFLGTATQQGRGASGGRATGSSGRPSVPITPDPSRNSRSGFAFNVHVASFVTARSNASASTTQRRYGPSAVSAGAAVVLP
jgi:hypothetical protein